jgi:hypothetical protein
MKLREREEVVKTKKYAGMPAQMATVRLKLK